MRNYDFSSFPAAKLKIASITRAISADAIKGIAGKCTVASSPVKRAKRMV